MSCHHHIYFTSRNHNVWVEQPSDSLVIYTKTFLHAWVNTLMQVRKLHITHTHTRTCSSYMIWWWWLFATTTLCICLFCFAISWHISSKNIIRHFYNILLQTSVSFKSLHIFLSFQQCTLKPHIFYGMWKESKRVEYVEKKTQIPRILHFIH